MTPEKPSEEEGAIREAMNVKKVVVEGRSAKRRHAAFWRKIHCYVSFLIVFAILWPWLSGMVPHLMSHWWHKCPDLVQGTEGMSACTDFHMDSKPTEWIIRRVLEAMFLMLVLLGSWVRRLWHDTIQEAQEQKYKAVSRATVVEAPGSLVLDLEDLDQDDPLKVVAPSVADPLLDRDALGLDLDAQKEMSPSEASKDNMNDNWCQRCLLVFAIYNLLMLSLHLVNQWSLGCPHLLTRGDGPAGCDDFHWFHDVILPPLFIAALHWFWDLTKKLLVCIARWLGCRCGAESSPNVSYDEEKGTLCFECDDTSTAGADGKDSSAGQTSKPTARAVAVLDDFPEGAVVASPKVARKTALRGGVALMKMSLHHRMKR